MFNRPFLISSACQSSSHSSWPRHLSPSPTLSTTAFVSCSPSPPATSVCAMKLLVIGTVERAHAVASESVISDHVTAPELPEPDDATQAKQSQPFAFPTRRSSSSPRSSRFPHLPPSLSANRTQATYSQDVPLATHQASSAEKTRIAQIGPANDKPEDNTAPRCTRSALPSPTVPRSGPIRKDSE